MYKAINKVGPFLPDFGQNFRSDLLEKVKYVIKSVIKYMCDLIESEKSARTDSCGIVALCLFVYKSDDHPMGHGSLLI